MKNVTVMFPYPSGAGLHIGHFYNYALIDSYCRWLRLKGEEVFQPFGYDSFGLPAENYAIKHGRDVKEVTEENIFNFRKQMYWMDTQYDTVLQTHGENYQRETQMVFNILKSRGLAYKKKGIVNYDPIDKTVLANEQVVDGIADRSGAKVELIEMEQWYFKITDYTDRLIKNLDTIDYPKKTINAQRKWLENQHDWCVSRQRKWGCPIPVEGETDTLDTFVDSSFYYIVYQLVRGIEPKQIDLYVGGSEHACMHLIYARFINMVLFDEGIVDFEEPFKKVIHQGMITYNGSKMSKSTGNVVDPTDFIQEDLRAYMMFIGHYFDGGEFDGSKMKGVVRFKNRMKIWLEKEPIPCAIDMEPWIKKLDNFYDSFKFNKVLSTLMEFYNKHKELTLSLEQNNLVKSYLSTIFTETFKNYE